MRVIDVPKCTNFLKEKKKKKKKVAYDDESLHTKERVLCTANLFQ